MQDIDRRIYRNNLSIDGKWYLDCVKYDIQKYDLCTSDISVASLKADELIKNKQWEQEMLNMTKSWPLFLDARTNKKIHLNPYFLQNDSFLKAEIEAGFFVKIEE